MHHRNRTPLRVSVAATFATILVVLLFGGASYATDEAQSSSGITTEAQSVNTIAQSSGETQPTGATTVAVVADNETQPANGGRTCIPQDISPGEVDVAFKTSDGSSEVTAFEEVEFSISLTLEQGHCAGDSIVITVPTELGTDGDFAPVPMKTPEGVAVGYATYNSDHTVRVVLTSAVEDPTRHNFHASAWWRVHMSPELIPGETRELRWDIDGVVRRTNIHVGTCDGCSTVGKDPSKWGSVDGSRQHVTVVLPTADHDGQEFVVTDTLTSPGQKFVCDQLLVGRIGVYTAASTWGQPQYIRFMEANVVSCASDKAVINVKLDKGEKARFQLNINVGSTDPGPWSDSAVITSQGESWEVTARVTRRESGGNAGFDNTPTPAPSPAPTPTPVPTPSASPSPTPVPTPTPAPTPSPTPVTPSASPSPSPTPVTPSASPSPSTTPEPSPSATPVPTPTPSTTPAPVPTPSATPTPAPQHKKLAVTGAGNTVTSATALAVLGGIALWTRRRQTAHPED